MKIGLIGLGNMGYNLMLNLLDNGYQVVAWNRSEVKRVYAREQLTDRANLKIVDELTDLVDTLASEPRQIIISIISAGDGIDKLFFGENYADERNISAGLANLLNPKSIILEMANSHYKDSVRRSKLLEAKEISMLDIGISGGIDGAKKGACLMIGGDYEAFEYTKPIFLDLSVENGFGYFGSAGAGHYVKMVHNAIEYGMMQSLGEGISLIDAKEEYRQIDYSRLLDVWNNGSIIQGKLLGFLKEAFDRDPGLTNQSAEIGDKGTGKWASQEALELGVPLTSITHALFSRYNSRLRNTIAWKSVMAMRQIFGGHRSSDRS